MPRRSLRAAAAGALLLCFFLAPLGAQAAPRDLLETVGSEFFITGGASVKLLRLDRGGLRDGMRALASEKKTNPWDVSLMTVLRTAVKPGEVVYFSFYARSVSGDGAPGNIQYSVQKNSPDWSSIASGQAELPREWKRFAATAKAATGYASGDLKVVFMMGAQKQEIEVSSVQLLLFPPETSLEEAKRVGDLREPPLRKAPGKITFMGVTDKNPLAYKTGETMTFTIQLLEDGLPVAGKNLAWKCVGDDGVTNEGKALSSSNAPLVLKASVGKPGFVRALVYAQDASGINLKVGGQNAPYFDGGAGADVEKITGVAEPKDFDAYWKKQAARLKGVPVRADLAPIESPDPELVGFDIKVDCPGKMPVSGYFCKPKAAAPRSLPARVSYNGYGVSGAYKPWSKGNLSLNINAHGILNGQPADYYAALKQTTLSNYAFFEEENKNPDTAYFNGMILRVLRSLEFIKAQPEWDGSNLIVSGGSQGGFQCLIAAALDRQVSRCEANIPWCCDLGGVTLGRMPGWRPGWVEGLGYYDAANHAKRIACPTTIYAGLGDYTCPPSGEMVLFNNMKGPVKLDFQQGRTHGYTMPGGAIYTLKKNWKD